MPSQSSSLRARALCLVVLVLASVGVNRVNGQTVNLGSASSYAIIAYATITSTGPSSVVGEMGLSPGSSITGFPPATCSGTQQSANGAAATALADANTAYTAAKGLPCTNTLTAVELAGLTLTPGVYCLPATASITGVLTLSGPAGSSWVFQLATVLTVANAASINIIGGANECNVVWAIGSATVGTTAAIQGTFLSYAAISLATGATVSGRLVSSTAAVTLESNTVDTSACSATAASSLVDESLGTSHLLVPGQQLRLTVNNTVQAIFDKSLIATIVSLGSAQNYAILAASTITNTGPSTITGNVGLAGTSLTGAPTVNGVTNINNAAASTAIADALTAFTALNALPCTVTLANAQLGGLTLTPGVYCFSAANVLITGNLVLNAQNNAAASFVFRVAGVLAVSSGSTVALINGGSLCNVFWAITSGSLSTTAAMIGTVLAQQGFTLATGATLNGRALAITTAVTLQSNTIDVSACTSASLTTVAVHAAVLQNATLPAVYTPVKFSSVAVDGFSIVATNGAPSSVRLVSPSLDANTVSLLAQPNQVAQVLFLSSSFVSAVPLGASQSYAVISAATITNSGTSNVIGALALTPGTAIVGAPSVSGETDIANANAAAAMLAAANAYTLLKGLTCTKLMPVTELAGLTLTPGIYCWTAADISLTGGLILDAQNDANAVFVFQIAGILNVATVSSVRLINGGSICNVFWAVSSAVLGKAVIFSGTITAYAAITIDAGSYVTGRVVTTTAAIGLVSSTIDNSQCQSTGVVLAVDSAAATPSGKLQVTYAAPSVVGSYFFVVADTSACGSISGCASCTSSTQCVSCSSGNLSTGHTSCGTCQADEYVSMGVCYTCSSAMLGCTSCSSQYVCADSASPSSAAVIRPALVAVATCAAIALFL